MKRVRINCTCIRQACSTVIAALLLLTLQPLVVLAGEISMDLASNTINISTFYNGTAVKASGVVPAAADVIVEVSGPKKNVALKVKGKVAGFLWMNKTDVELENTPAVYMVYTPADLTTELEGLGVGYQALVNDITMEPDTADKSFVFTEYVKLMEKSGVYKVKQGAVQYGPVQNGVKPWSVTLAIPPKMSAGDYHVRAMSVQRGAVTATTGKKLHIQLTGLPKIIAKLAFEHSLFFGIMAVLIAVATGLIIGMIFKGGGGAH